MGKSAVILGVIGIGALAIGVASAGKAKAAPANPARPSPAPFSPPFPPTAPVPLPFPAPTPIVITPPAGLPGLPGLSQEQGPPASNPAAPAFVTALNPGDTYAFGVTYGSGLSPEADVMPAMKRDGWQVLSFLPQPGGDPVLGTPALAAVQATWNGSAGQDPMALTGRGVYHLANPPFLLAVELS